MLLQACTSLRRLPSVSLVHEVECIAPVLAVSRAGLCRIGEVVVEPKAVEPLVVEPEATAVVQASTVESEVAVPQESKDEPEVAAPVEVQR